ncbi:MAG: hypothetical protein KatS3mg095_0547 [Candidatus Parcubacteria bacterium]|nr:MAG: hypothetical protein KatS3mg095_0547 [Candidatus Parcubacteria bacterium]
MNNLDIKIKEFIEKIKNTKKEFDLSSDEDLSVALMNLISIEEHFFFTGAKTEKKEYFDLINEVRKIRKELLKMIIKDYEGEIWCISKHLLAASMRLIEVGTKELEKGNKEIAYDLFEKAYNLYSLFWALNLKIIDIGEIKKIDEDKINKKDKESNSAFKKLGEIVQKLIDCCKE